MARAEDKHTPEAAANESFAARLREKYGEGVDPGVSLDRPDAQAPTGVSSELLRRLAKLPVRAPDGERRVVEPRYRIARGGSFFTPSARARSALRIVAAPEKRTLARGLRPVRAISGP